MTSLMEFLAEAVISGRNSTTYDKYKMRIGDTVRVKTEEEIAVMCKKTGVGYEYSFTDSNGNERTMFINTSMLNCCGKEYEIKNISKSDSDFIQLKNDRSGYFWHKNLVEL